MVVKVSIFAYATGAFSWRGLARMLKKNVAFQVLQAGNFPSLLSLFELRRREDRLAAVPAAKARVEANQRTADAERVAGPGDALSKEEPSRAHLT